MPELPEVENVRLSLMQHVLGKKVRRVAVARPSVIHGLCTSRNLGAGQAIQKIERLGKQLALVFDRVCVCVHLGMTGSLQCGNKGKSDHVHITWHLAGGGQIRFRDPRRFGGVWTFTDQDQLQRQRWDKLGEDALTMAPTKLHRKLVGTQQAIKAVLLDQHVIAGLGNIYVDELLFTLKVHPLTRANELDIVTIRRLVRVMRRLLNNAVEAGGSTLRDYVDAQGRAGRFQQMHQVYGQRP